MTTPRRQPRKREPSIKSPHIKPIPPGDFHRRLKGIEKFVRLDLMERLEKAASKTNKISDVLRSAINSCLEDRANPDLTIAADYSHAIMYGCFPAGRLLCERYASYLLQNKISTPEPQR